VQGSIHGILKSAWGSSKTEGHNLEFKLAKMGLKSGLELLTSLHSNLMKSRLEIKTSEPSSAC
jgi:hypothetical protein